MPSATRRSLFKMAGAAAGALAAPGLISRAAFADSHATMSDAEFEGFSLGDFTIRVLSDGHRTVSDPQSIFGTDQTVEDVAALLDENLLPPDQMQFTFAPTLVDTGSEVVLFDTGNGEGGREGGVGRTRAALEAAGYAPGDVSIVVLTHLHPDHIGGLMEAGAPAFPNARYVTGRAEYDWWTSEERVGTAAENGHNLVRRLVVPFADDMTFVEDGGDVTGGITAMAAFGHTPGHMIFMVESGGRPLAITADTANHFVLSLQRPDWQVRFDVDKAGAAATRKRVFDMLATDRIAFVGYHMPFPSVGFVEKRDTGYRFIPETYQFDI